MRLRDALIMLHVQGAVCASCSGEGGMDTRVLVESLLCTLCLLGRDRDGRIRKPWTCTFHMSRGKPCPVLSRGWADEAERAAAAPWRGEGSSVGRHRMLPGYYGIAQGHSRATMLDTRERPTFGHGKEDKAVLNANRAGPEVIRERTRFVSTPSTKRRRV